MKEEKENLFLKFLGYFVGPIQFVMKMCVFLSGDLLGLTSWYGGEWRNQWIPKFLDVHKEEHEVFAEYIMAIGAV